MGGGQSSPGFVGHSKFNVTQGKFILGDGGLLRMVWMPKILKEEIKERIERRGEALGYPNLYDMPPYSAIRLGDLKLIYWHATRKLELFNLKKDIGEKNNLAGQQADDVSRLAKILADHLRATDALMPIDKQSNQPVPMPDQLTEQ